MRGLNGSLNLPALMAESLEELGLTRDESHHMLEGRLRIDLYDDRGRVARTLRLGEPGSASPFLVRVRKGTWHANVPETEHAVFHESRPGPFLPADTVFPEWA